MRLKNSATQPIGTLLSPATHSPRSGLHHGIFWGFVGVLGFSLTLPLTRVATLGGALDPIFIGAFRAVIAGVIAAIALLVTRQKFPNLHQWFRIGVVALGVVFGFPLLTTFAMTTTSASHGAVVIALLPVSTAIVAALRTREYPRPAFWIFAGLGAVATVIFATIQGGSLGGVSIADLLLIAAVACAAIGYTESGLLSRELGAWQTISWALVLSLPVMALLSIVPVTRGIGGATGAQWLSVLYIGVVSMFLAFVAWNRGLAIGPLAQVSQIQLVQPVLGLGWATVLLGESLSWSALLSAVAVIACAAGAVLVKGPRRTPSRKAMVVQRSRGTHQ
ncbi:DMT family transporter [Haematomicrobium sanguinis]|uniref:DMT family transporter n=1 Tax=Haematomicrobium sanguinis TaxID=479106 RepID=UPI000689DD7B|nr:DMT family transporter [Haematomicrobium sanguinis]